MVRKVYVLLPAVLSLTIQSCAPKLLTMESCDSRFREQVLRDSKVPENFNFSASAVISGFPAIIKGVFSKDKDSLNFSSPFGKNLLSLERKNNTLCVKAPGFETCDGQEMMSMISLYSPQLTVLADINLLKGLIVKKFYLTEKDRFECEGNSLKVLRKDYTLLYQDGEIRQISYKNFTVDYGLNNQIEIKDGSSTVAKISISNINFNNY